MVIDKLTESEMTAQDHHQVHADGTPCSCDSETFAGTAVDPICGMTVVKEGAKYTASYEGQTFYFCSAGCQSQFLTEPTQWAAKAAAIETGHKHSHDHATKT